MQNDVTTTLDIEQLTGEALVLGFLGKALYNVPERAWLQGLIVEQVFAEVPFGADQAETLRGLEILQAWSRSHEGGISDEDFSGLKLDYTRLFIGLDPILPVPPWESVYLNKERMVFQEETRQVRGWYQRFNLLPEKFNKEPDDHIALELIFLAKLAQSSLQALEQKDQQALENYCQAQAGFLTEHLLRWGLVWCRLMEEHAATDFYRGLGYLTHGSLLALAATLNVKLPKEATL
jgi:putative dimethyl sulfoxide reductase chaperone